MSDGHPGRHRPPPSSQPFLALAAGIVKYASAYLSASPIAKSSNDGTPAKPISPRAELYRCESSNFQADIIRIRNATFGQFTTYRRERIGDRGPTQ